MRKSARSVLSVCLVCGCLATLVSQAVGQEADALAQADRMVRSSDAAGGICAVLGVTDADLSLALEKQGPFVVHCLATSRELVGRIRGQIRSRGMYGAVSAGMLSGPRLPYTDNLINIVVIASADEVRNAGVTATEVLRVLAPLGTVQVRSDTGKDWRESLKKAGAEVSLEETASGSWLLARKPWPDDIDEWTHYLHGPDGNPVARDLVVGPPEHYQWLAGPLWQRSHETDSSISTLVSARGRLYYIVDEAPISLAGQHSLPDKWFLAARDAFNGVDLWKVPIRRWGWREWKGSWFNTRPGDIPLNVQKRLVAVEDRVYATLGYRAPVSELDARTGEILRAYEGTERTNEILYLDGKLFLSILTEDGIRISLVDASSGKQRWVSENAYRGTTVDYIKWKEMHGGITPAVLDPSVNMATDGHVVALLDGPDIVGLDATSGAETWRVGFPTAEGDLTAGGIRSKGNLWIGTMITSHDVALHASPSKLAAFSAKDGKLLWSQPKRYIQHLWYEWKDVFVIGDLVWTWNAELARSRSLYPTAIRGYDIRTGELKKSVDLGAIFSTYHHHRCYRNKATPRYILASRRGTEFVDLEEGKHTVHNWVRGTCHVGMMPANGLHYAPPHPCQCYIDEKLNGMNALAAARPAAERPRNAPRLEKGPAFEKAPSAEEPGVGEEDWPAFRRDSLRTGAVATRVPDDAKPLWRIAAGARVSAPIAVRDRVWVSLADEHHVACLDAKDGSEVWSFATGGRVDSPPTYHRGAVLFGSRDGHVYCVRASDGVLAWRSRVAPEERLIGAFGQLESAWPVHGSVLIEKDLVYATAGRTSQLDGGIHLVALEAATGEVRHQTVLSGPDYAVGDFKENYQLPMGSLPDVLLSDGSRITMRSKGFDLTLKPLEEKSKLEVPGGFLDDTYFKRIPWRLGGDYARLIVHDNRSAYYIRMFDTLRGLDPTVFFTPGSEGYLLFARNMQGKKPSWTKRVPVRVRAMVLAQGRLFVAGPPDVMDERDPLGAFEGRRGGRLYVIDAGSGDLVAEQDLPSPPVFNGAAAARGRLFVVTEDGHVACFGAR